jgi:hypothetical protein
MGALGVQTLVTAEATVGGAGCSSAPDGGPGAKGSPWSQDASRSARHSDRIVVERAMDPPGFVDLLD